MTYKKFLIVASKLDKAGVNITTQLSQFREKENSKFDFYLCEKEIIYDENLDMERINKYDFIIFASKHKAKDRQKALCVHAPGNWGSAELGGAEGKVSKVSAQFNKQILAKLKENADKYNLTSERTGYIVTMEATHHGPSIDKPCLFIEIGATETEWADRRAAFVVAKTISEAIESFEINKYNEVAIAIGGPHYCQGFNKIQLKSNFAISHVIPQHALPLTEKMIVEAMDKTDEEIDLAIIDWKGMGNSEQRKESLDVLDKIYLRYERSVKLRK